MNAIPKALSMATPTNITACAAAVAGVIASKFAIDNTTTGNVNDIEEEPVREFIKSLVDEETLVEIKHPEKRAEEGEAEEVKAEEGKAVEGEVIEGKVEEGKVVEGKVEEKQAEKKEVTQEENLSEMKKCMETFSECVDPAMMCF